MSPDLHRHFSVTVAESVFGDFDSEANVLSAVDLSQSLARDDYRKALAKQQARLRRLSIEARTRGVSTVLAFEGWDAAGKGGVIRRVTGALEAGDYRVIPVAAPTEEERKYHYLWRFWRDLPPAGRFVIFDRTWYGRVLVERVEKFARKDEWQRAYGEINQFEKTLTDDGMVLVKFWIHISKKEQLDRFKKREKDPWKNWKLTEEDWRNREKWDAYIQALEEMFEKTDTENAPWTIVEGNWKWWARIKALKTVVNRIEAHL